MYNIATEAPICELFEAMGDRRNNDVKMIIERFFNSRLMSNFRIASTERPEPTEISPLAFVANKVQSESLFRLLVGFAESHQLVDFFSRLTREMNYNKIAIRLLYSDCRIESITAIARWLNFPLKSTEQFSHLKEYVRQTYQEDYSSFLNEVSRYIQVAALCHMVVEYMLVPPIPEVLSIVP
jgi:hypothetical protein